MGLKGCEPIYRFTDYHVFLRKAYSAARARNPRWSWGAWARKLGLEGGTSLLKVASGKRQAGAQVRERLIRYFKFSAREREYFEALIELSKARARGDQALMDTLRERLARINPTREFTLVDEATFQSVSIWWTFAIRQYLRTPGASSDPRKIARALAFKVPVREVADAIDTMVRLGLLRRAANGALSPADGALDSAEGVRVEAARRYHEEALDLARRSVREISVTERELGAAALAFKRENMPRVQEWIRAKLAEFNAEFAAGVDGDSVYMIQMQWIPLAKG